MAQKTLLLIEDDAFLTEEIKNFFEKEGYKVESAIDGETGLKQAFELKPDAILLDIVVPKLNGVDFLTKLKEDAWGKTAPVIILTNMDNHTHLAKVEALGSYDYLVKTECTLDDILSRVNQKMGNK